MKTFRTIFSDWKIILLNKYFISQDFQKQKPYQDKQILI